MKFRLFSKTEFEVRDPISLIEGYCFLLPFYASYDLHLIKVKGDKRIDRVGSIGARIQEESLRRCKKLIWKAKSISIFTCDLDQFLALDNEDISRHVRELCDGVLKELLAVDGIRLSTATKMLHTRYPDIIPMIDSMLQQEYRQSVYPGWKQNNPERILLDYYKNLREQPTKRNLAQVYDTVSKRLPGLSKVRVFDILWWSYLKAKTLKKQTGIDWATVKQT